MINHPRCIEIGVRLVALIAVGSLHCLLGRAQELASPDQAPGGAGVERDGRPEQTRPMMDMGLVELEALAEAALADGQDAALPLSRMFSLSRKDEDTAKQYLEAMERLLPLFATDDGAWEAQLRMARTAQYLEDHAYVDQLYEGLVNQDPELATEAGRAAYYNHAQALYQRGELEEAVQRFRKVWDIAARHSPLEFETMGRQLANTYATMGDWESMVEVGSSVLGRMDDGRGGFVFAFHLANAYEQVEQYDEAVALYQRIYNFVSKMQIEDPENQIFTIEAYSRDNIEKRLDWAKARQEGKFHRDRAHARRAGEVTAAFEKAFADTDTSVSEVAVVGQPAPEAVKQREETTSTGAGSVPRFWMASAGLLALIAVPVVVKLAR